MVRITDELTLSRDEVTLYHATDSYLGNLPILVFHGPSIISNSTLNSSRIQVHIFSVAGFQSYKRITISPNLPFHQSVNYLPREKQGDEICRGIAFCLLKYFRELPDSVKNSLVLHFTNPKGKQSLSISSLFSEQHAALLASTMVKAENTVEIWDDILAALRPQNVNHLDLDLILPSGSVQNIQKNGEIDDSNAESDQKQYGKYESLVQSFGDVTFLPSTRLRRAPSRANSINRPRSFSTDQKTSLRREMGELVDTEERYVIKMHELVHHVANDFREKAKNRILSSYSPSLEDLERLFPSSLDKILQINSAFLEAVQNVMDETEEDAMLDLEAPVVTSTISRSDLISGVKDPTGAVALSKILLEWFPQFSDCYQEYIRASQEFPQIITSFIKQQSSFSKRVQIVGEQYLRSAVIEPVQRLPRYSLFIDNIVSCLPSLHPAIKPFLKARDIITSICSMDTPGSENTQVAQCLGNLIEAWPINFIQQNRLVTAVDYVELASPFRNIPDSDSYKGMFLIFTDRIVLLKKLPRCGMTARGFLAELDKPSASSMIASMTATASGNKRIYDLSFSSWYMLSEIRFTVSDDSRNVSLISTCQSEVDIKSSDKNKSSIRIFHLLGAYEGKGSKFTEEITKARIEGRFPESERDSTKWSFRSTKSEAIDITLHTAIFEERTIVTSSDRQEAAPIRILVDHASNVKVTSNSHVGVEIIANITTKQPGVEYRLKITGLRDKAFVDEVTTEKLLPTLATRLADLLRFQYSLNNMVLTTPYISLYGRILKSMHFQYERDKQRSFMPSSPVKLLSNLFNATPSVSGSRNSKISNKINFSPLSRSDSIKSKFSLDENESRAELRYHDDEQVDNHLIKLEEIFKAYTISIYSRKGNVVGRALRNYGNTDELAVNAVYNTFIENPDDQRIASEVTIDILFAAFKKYLRIAWMEQMGNVVSQQTLDELRLQALRLGSGDFTQYVRLILSEMTPQNRRAFISIVKLLADLLDGCFNDGDQGAITAAFAELLALEGNPHDYINLLDRLVMDQEMIFQAIGTGAVYNGSGTNSTFTSISGSKSNASAMNSIASNSSSFRKRFAETLLRQNSSQEKQSVWRSLNKSSRSILLGDQLNSNTNSQMPLRRSRSIESPNRRSAIKDRPTVIGAFEERPLSSSGSTAKSNINGTSSINENLDIKKSKKKRRSSLSDLKTLNSATNLDPSIDLIPPSKEMKVGQVSSNSNSHNQSPSKIPLAGVSLDRSHSKVHRTESLVQKENINLSSSVRIRKTCRTEPSKIKTSTPPPNNSSVVLIKDLWTTPSLKKHISLNPTNIPTLDNRPKSNLTNASRPPTSHSNITRSPQKLRLQSHNKPRLSSPHKLRERIQNEDLAIQNAETDIILELSRIEAQIARLNSSDRLLRPNQQNSEKNTLTSLQLSFSSLAARIPNIIADLTARNQLVEAELKKSVSALEFKMKGLDQLYREVAAENELLYERFNGELTKIARAVKYKVEDGISNTEGGASFNDELAENDDLVNKIIETTDEIARVRSENTKLKREVLSLKTLLKVSALSNSQFTPFNDCDDRNDLVTPKNSQLHRPNAKYKSHVDAVSAGISIDHSSQSNVRHHPKRISIRSPTTTSPLSCEEQSDTQGKSHKALHVSRNTLSAILYTVEALRLPHSFSPDIIEETASMSGQIDALSSSSRQTGENDNPRSNTIVGPATSVKGPREVMRERTAREARRKAELEQKEALERIRATEEAILLEERQLINERRMPSDFDQGFDRDRCEDNETAPRDSNQIPITIIANNPQTEKRDSSENVEGRTFSPQSNRGPKQAQVSVGGGNFRGPRSRPRQPDNQSKSKHTDNHNSHNSNQVGRSAVSGMRSSFPHAFERWETLSAHWEGLTSFWIRRLEENGREIERDPLLQQLSRQVTDLSAAGANLFHAVVELQRLRASSERKFQRWFFETRTEQERNQEIQASIERKLQTEVEARVAAVAQAATEERERSNAEKQLAEVKRELQISKEEAKRAWEELGRREKEERARTTSLREGLPTVIGGVEVVPMITGPPNRPGTARRTDYTVERPESSRDNNPPNDGKSVNPGYSQRSYDVSDSYHDTSDSRATPVAQNVIISNPILNEPSFTGQKHGEKSADTSTFQPDQETSNLKEQNSLQTTPESLDSYSDQEEDEYEMDSQEDLGSKNLANTTSYQSELNYIRGSEQYESDMERLQQYDRIPDVEYGRGIQVTADYLQNPGSYSVPDIEIGDMADYTDLDQQGYISGPEWSNVPRHHHPTRLSDVMEEDERSRTSASQMSRTRD